MRKLLVLVVFILCGGYLSAQDVTGQWNGAISIQGMQLRIVLHIEKTEKEYAATFDSPDQGAKGIKIDTLTFSDDKLRFVVNKGRIVYEGSLNANKKIVGTFKQAGQWFPLEFGRETIESDVKLVRSQEPVKPYPYYTEEIKFKNKKAGITLAGTLSLPQKKGKFPVVVLISGSGPQDRDESLLGHKPFLVIADYLTSRGMGVLRFDDRGTFASTGDFSKATTEDFAGDVLAAVNFLKKRGDIDKKHIGLIGHSEGGIIAPMVAAKSPDVSFIVLLAGTGIKGSDLLLLQQELIAKSQGATEAEAKEAVELNRGAYKIIEESKNMEYMKRDLTSYYVSYIGKQPDFKKPEGATDQDIAGEYVKQLTSPWMLFFLQYDPSLILKDVKCPVLVLNGSKDLQVPSKINLEAIRAGLEKGGNMDVTIKEFPNMNHLFQECETGAIEEYAKIDQTVSPIVLNEIAKWLAKEVKK